MTDEMAPTGPGPRRRRHARFIGGGVIAVAVVGAAAGLVAAGIPGGGDRVVPPGVAPSGGLRPLAHLTGAMVSFGGCTDYLSYVRQRAEAMAGPYGLTTTSLPGAYGGPLKAGGPVGVPQMATGTAAGGATAAGGGAAAGATAAGGGAAAAASGAPVAAAAPSQAASGTTGSAGSLSYSQTDDQVAGVDEPDTVKTDGRLVLTLTGSTLRVLDTTAHVLGSVQLPGDTGGGFLLDGGRAVVFSSPAPAVPGTTTAAAGPAAGVYQPAYAGYPVNTGVNIPVAAAQATIVDLTDPTNPQVLRTFRFAGGIVAARLVGSQVRLVLRSDGPDVSFATPSSQGDAASAAAWNKQLMATSTLAQWLPWWQTESPDGAMTAHQPLSACGSIVRPSQASGISTVTVLSLDPQSTAPGPGTSVVGAGDTVYATADRLYVAGPVASSAGLTPAGEPYGCCSLAPPVGASTRIYAFGTPASGAATFAGEGTVPGWLVNSYAMDEDSNGLLRVASTSEGPGGSSHSQITVLSSSGGELTAVGSVSGLGEGEFLRAVRFVGDQAYVVTFRTFDPLYVVDLSKPTHPVLTGELDQPGFSEFLYPLPDHRLLGVGVQLTDNEPSGLVVATYDVSDPAHPSRISVSELAQGFYFQGYDPHAFLYWAPAGLALLALPGGGTTGGPMTGDAMAGGAMPGTDSGVAAYQIGPGGGLTRTATLGHDGQPADRSLVVDGQVWVTAPGGVVTSALTDLPAMTWHSY